MRHDIKLIWKHKKYGKAEYDGQYKWTRGERVFELFCAPKKHRVTFESYQAAKDLGWVGKK
jgi:hypothetical protein